MLIVISISWFFLKNLYFKLQSVPSHLILMGYVSKTLVQTILSLNNELAWVWLILKSFFFFRLLSVSDTFSFSPHGGFVSGWMLFPDTVATLLYDTRIFSKAGGPMQSDADWQVGGGCRSTSRFSLLMSTRLHWWQAKICVLAFAFAGNLSKFPNTNFPVRAWMQCHWINGFSLRLATLIDFLTPSPIKCWALTNYLSMACWLKASQHQTPQCRISTAIDWRHLEMTPRDWMDRFIDLHPLVIEMYFCLIVDFF